MLLNFILLLTFVVLIIFIYINKKNNFVNIMVIPELLYKFVIILAILVPAIYQIANVKKYSYLSHLFRSKNISSSLYGLIFILIWFLLFLCLVHIIKKHNTETKKIYIFIVIVIIFTFARFLFVKAYSQELFTDFLRMWEWAKVNVFIGFSTPMSFQQERALPFLTPLLYFFGYSSESLYKFANIIVLTITSLLGALLIRKWHSIEMATLYFFIVSTVPETYYAMLITSHDIYGVFYLFIYMYVLYKIYDKINDGKYLISLAMSVLLGILLFLIEIQRTIATHVIVATIVFIIFSFVKNASESSIINKKNVALTLFIILMPLLIYTQFIKITDNNIIFSRNSKKNIIYTLVAAYGTTRSDGTLRSYIEFNKNYFSKLPISYKKIFTKKIILSDLVYNYKNKVGNYLLRSIRLFNLGSQYYYYIGKLLNINKKQAECEIIKYRVVCDIYKYVFLFITIIASVIYIINKTSNIKIVLPLTISIILILQILLLGENQPRYLFIIWYVWPFLFINSFNSYKKIKYYNPREILSAIFVCVVLFIIIVLIGLKIKNTNNIFLDFSNFETPCMQNKEILADPFLLKLNTNKIIVNNGDSKSYIYNINTNINKNYTLRVFETINNKINNNYAKNEICLSILINNIERYKIFFPSIDNQHGPNLLEIKNIEPKNNEINIEFKIINLTNANIVNNNIDEYEIIFEYLDIN